MGNAIALREFSEYVDKVEIFSRNDDDMSDRLNYMYTTFILIWFSTIVTCQQYVGDPIQCWTPNHFTKHHDFYTNSLCWTQNTYYVPFNGSIHPSNDESVKSSKNVIVYYQWVPIILLIQAFFFCLPRIFWKTFADHSGVEVGSLVESGGMLARFQMDNNIRETIIKQMARQVDRYLWSSVDLNNRKRHAMTISCSHVTSRTCFRMIGYRYANYIVMIYLVSKGLYVANVVTQLFVMNTFLGSTFSSYGFDAVSSMIRGDDWMASKRFPRVTTCDLNVRRLGNLHNYIVQCVLPVNLFNEKIFLFLWFWFALVALFTCLSTFAWILRIASQQERHRYAMRYLNIAGKLRNDPGRRKSFYFIHNYLRQDGVFLLRLLSAATNGLVAMEMTGALWDNLFKKPATRVKLEEAVSNVSNNNISPGNPGRYPMALTPTSPDAIELFDFRNEDPENGVQRNGKKRSKTEQWL